MFIRTKQTPLGRLRGHGRGLGCGACGGKRLGQDTSIYDMQYGGGNTQQFDAGVSYGAPAFGPSAPTPAQIAYDQTVTSGSTPNPTYNFQPLPSPAPSSAATTLLNAALNNPLVSPPSIPSALAPTAASASSLTAYLPYLLLGGLLIGGIAVLKRR
jgi:hypothetical protein